MKTVKWSGGEWSGGECRQKGQALLRAKCCLFLKRQETKKYISKKKTPKTKTKTIHQKELSHPKKVFQWPWSQHGPANFKPRPYTYCLNESVATKRPAYR